MKQFRRVSGGGGVVVLCMLCALAMIYVRAGVINTERTRAFDACTRFCAGVLGLQIFTHPPWAVSCVSCVPCVPCVPCVSARFLTSVLSLVHYAYNIMQWYMRTRNPPRLRIQPASKHFQLQTPDKMRECRRCRRIIGTTRDACCVGVSASKRIRRATAATNKLDWEFIVVVVVFCVLSSCL